MHFEKARGFYGQAAQPFEARYEVRDGLAVWTRTEMVDAERARVVAALKDGMSIRQAAEALGMHKSKVERLRKRAMETGELPCFVEQDLHRFVSWHEALSDQRAIERDFIPVMSAAVCISMQRT